LNFGKQSNQHFSVSFSHSAQTHGSFTMTTLEMFSVNVTMKYDDGFHWVGLKL